MNPLFGSILVLVLWQFVWLFPGHPGHASEDPSHTSYSAVTDKQAPSLQIPRSKVDFGHADEGSKVSHEFAVLNKGTAPLIIHQVRPG
ncbi:MAG: DUF1573 domain-containing protein [Syntrophobacteraceae bacterium]|jgi:hypothetical protein|nr:DUF1573 domain-containing protein [Syntrophobacteraceae bacterium]